MSRFVESWDDPFSRNEAAQPGIDAWFIHSTQRPSRTALDAALTSSTVLISPATDATTRAAWQALRGAFVFARVEHVRFEGANAVGALEYCLKDLPQITQAIVHAPGDRHDEIISQIGSVLSRVGAQMSVLLTRHDGPSIPETFQGCIRADESALARTTLSALMMFQSLDALVDLVCIDLADVRSVLGETASGARLVEALWLPADKKLVFCDSRDIDHVAAASALWVSIDAWTISLNETREIRNAYPLMVDADNSGRTMILNIPRQQWYSTALYGPLARVRILCR